jgi:hypothetical protein
MNEAAVLELVNHVLPRLTVLADEFECVVLDMAVAHLEEHQQTLQARMAGMI